MIISNPEISINIIFEDEDIIVIDKPAGIPCLPVKSGQKMTVAAGLATLYKGDCFGLRPRNDTQAEIVHRLDNDTSGVLLAAKNKGTFEKLRRQFDENKIYKQYIALVLGETPASGIIETPIVHDPKSKKRMKTFQVSGFRFQKAFTSYKLLKKYFAGRYSLLEVTIKTGVRHQIRVHLASIGHPIAGDKLYQNTRQRVRDKTELIRQFLHASKIGFPHPGTGERVEFESPLPIELRNVLTKLDGI